jgi:hypothetical protein
MSDTRARRLAGRASRTGAVGRLMSWRTPSRGLRPPLNPAPDEGPTPKAELYILKVPVGSDQAAGADRRLGPAAKAVRRLIAILQSWLPSSLTGSPRLPAGSPRPPTGPPRLPVGSPRPPAAPPRRPASPGPSPTSSRLIARASAVHHVVGTDSARVLLHWRLDRFLLHAAQTLVM